MFGSRTTDYSRPTTAVRIVIMFRIVRGAFFFGSIWLSQVGCVRDVIAASLA